MNYTLMVRYEQNGVMRTIQMPANHLKPYWVRSAFLSGNSLPYAPLQEFRDDQFDVAKGVWSLADS